MATSTVLRPQVESRAEEAPGIAQDKTVYAFFQGDYVSLKDAKISIMTHAFAYGTACFEGIRGYWNDNDNQLYLFRLDEHYNRLLESAKTLLMQVSFSAQDLCDITLELVRRCNLHEDVYIRPTFYKSDEVIGVRLHNLSNDLSIVVQPFGDYIDIDRALEVGVSSWRRTDDNMLPARSKINGAYVNSAFAKSEAQLNGFDEAIMLTMEGHVSEGSAENLFMMRGGKLITPPVTENILEGVTRATVMTLAREQMNLEVVERSIDRTELYAAEELFLTGTGAQIAPVGSVDHRTVGSGNVGPIAAAMQRSYFEAVRGKLPQYHHWLTPVY
jgi:branched-chain amino acid aminotransferase